MKNKIYTAAAAILWIILAIVLINIASNVTPVEASPLYNPATSTPVPTEIPDPDWYWTHEIINLTKSHPGTSGTYYSEALTAPGYDDVEAVYFEIIKRCPAANSHWAKGEWQNTEGGSWATWKQIQNCDGLIKAWWSQTGGQSYADTKTEISIRFGDPGDTAITETNASTTTDYRAVTSAGTNGDAGYTSEIDVYYLHYGADGVCSDDITLGSEPFGEGEIDATLEDGITIEIAENGQYGLEISGGPWNDGAVSRLDVAYSWDGIEWARLSGQVDEVSCTDDLETGGQMYYFLAQSDTLYLRVNDLADEFDDNTDEMDYAIYGVVGSGETGCGGNYTLGSLVFEESWDATFNDWQVPSVKSWPALSTVYFENYDIYRILIPHTYGDGSQYNSEAQIRPYMVGDWINLASHPQTVCVEDHDASYADPEGWMAYYFMSPEDFTLYEIRANDLDGTADASYDNNTGSFAVEVYSATYNPPVAGCAGQFTLGPLIQGIRIAADAQNGIRIPDPLYAYMRDDEGGLIAGTAYMIEEPSTWIGFTSLDSDSNIFDWQISADRTTWFDMDDFASCIKPIDTNRSQHFFDAAVTEYYVRAKDYDSDGTWLDQPGWILLNLYYANDLRTSPDANGDCPNLALGDVLYSGSVDSSELAGGYLPDILLTDMLYGIQLTTPAWTNDSVEQKAAQIQIAGSSTWDDFVDWDGAFCSELDGNDWPLNWIQALDARYKLRADATIGDNAGLVNYTIYEADWLTDPIYPSCQSNYNPISFANFPILKNEIPAQWQNGQHLQDFYLRQGTYEITTADGPWGDIVFGYPPIQAYDLEISIANGATNTWFDLIDAAACYVPMSDGNHARAYIEIPEAYDSFVRLRVNNLDDLWIDNTGSMSITVQYSNVGIDPDAPWDPYADPDGLFKEGGCDLVCVRPQSTINVPAWLEYFRCQLVRRLSFCPYHIEVLEAMRDLFYTRDPFGSIQELGQSFGLIKENVDSRQWSEEGGGDPTVGYPENFIFASPDGGGASIPIVGQDTIWGEGEINILGEVGEVDLTCTNNLAATLGTRLSQPVCFAFNVIDGLGLSSWFQFFWDISMLIACSMYFQNRWLKPMSS